MARNLLAFSLLFPCLCAPALGQGRGMDREARQELRRGFRGHEARLRELSREIHRLRRELGGSLERLERLRARYAEPERRELARGERGEARRAAQSRLLELERFQEELEGFRDEFKRDTEPLLDEPRLPERARRRMVEALEGTSRMAQGARELKRRGREALEEDEAAFSAAGRLVRARLRGGLLVLGLLAGLAAAVLLALRYRGQLRRLSAERTTAPGARTPITAEAETAPATPGLLPAPGTPPARSAAPTPGPGAVLQGIYRIERELGRGGMGVVYEAFDTALERKVAVKRMREEIKEVARDYELFLKEARLVASLRHPNVVEIFSILQENGDLFLIFELVEGETLRQVLNRSPGYRLALPWIKSTTAQVASALDYAHSKRVIHRDLKPSNIMLTRAGEARVMDFGIAHRAKLTVAKQTRAMAWGTPPYMAPEQELGTVSRESDVFALGVCLYEMLTGKVPYEGPNFLAQKQGMAFAPPTRAAGGLPPAVDAVIARALRPEPEKRFRSARELALAVQSL